MKELSIEQKAIAYDEAIKKAKSLYKVAEPMSGCNVILETIFPELRETEDDKIKKELLENLRELLEMYNTLQTAKEYSKVQSWIDWVEKQGAKVSAIEGFESEFERQVSGLIASAINKEHEYNQGYIKWTANALLNYAKHELEKQDEQKSADKVEPKFKVGDIITPKDRGHEPWQVMQVDILDKKYRFKDGYIIHFSQEDDYELIEQKPTWSEEDEKMLSDIIKDLVHSWNEYIPNRIEYEIKWLKNRLKSLRPQNTWKPSEEQMKALAYAVFDTQSYSYHKNLSSLEQQLKKLKE